eukprot:scaffold23068_cov70-Phaeocystis_antarctica.AAC.5
MVSWTVTLVVTTGLGATVTSMPSSAESAERLLLFQTLSALVIFTAGSSVMVTTRSSATSRRECAVRRSRRRRDAPKLSDTARSGRPSMLATWRRTTVSLNASTSATSTWSGSSSTVWLIACSTTLVTVVVCCPSGITIGMLPGTSFT